MEIVPFINGGPTNHKNSSQNVSFSLFMPLFRVGGQLVRGEVHKRRRNDTVRAVGDSEQQLLSKVHIESRWNDSAKPVDESFTLHLEMKWRQKV